MITYYTFPTNIAFGAGSIKLLPAYLKQYQLSRPLIVTDPTVRQLPFFSKIVQQLEEEGISPLVFDQLHKNPVKSDVEQGKQAYNQGNCHAIVGIGGGVALDVARAIALSINHGEDLFHYDELEGGTQYITEEIPPLIAVPTTAGTGSEVGRSAIISENDSKRKRILFHPSLMTRQVFADPELTYDMPAQITAATGMDALTHHIEAFLAKGYHPMADGIALEGIRMIFNSLEKAVKQPCPSSRAQMLMASMMGAVAFQKGLGIVHATAHPLSTLADMHHGLANAIMLPYGLRYNMDEMEEKFIRMGDAIGLPVPTPLAFVEAVESLRAATGIPNGLTEQGIDVAHIDALTELALQDFCLPANAKPAGRNDLSRLYHEACHAGIPHQ